MDQLSGKTAFVTGGAGGIGYAIAQAFLREGMKVVIADVDEDALASAAASLAGSNTEVLPLQLDVTDRAQYAAAVEQAWREFGAIHVLCNNAGVYRGGSIDQVTYEDWDWVMGVNVGGVINGIQTFTDRIKRHGQGGHIVNTASMAGVTTSPGLGVYNASKFAVVGMSESMRLDLEPHNIGVSVLCPGMVRTRILESERTRPENFEVSDASADAAAKSHNEMMQMAMNTGIDAADVAALVVEAVKTNQLHIFPHAELKSAAEDRLRTIVDAFGEPDPERVAAQEKFMADLLQT